MPLPYFAPSSMSVPALLPSHGFSPIRPALSTRRAGRYDGVAAAIYLLACPSARHLIRAVRHRMATGLGDCLVKLTPCLFPAPCPSSVRCRLLPARSLNPIYSSPRFALPSPITRHGGRGDEALLLSVAYSARSLLRFDFVWGRFVRVL